MANNAGQPRRGLSRWLLPSLPQWLWLLLLLGLLGQPWRTMMVSGDGDPCMHWRVGEWMLQHRHILREDEFSHTRYRQPFISKEWLSEIIFATAGRLGGLLGLDVVSALVIATTFALLFRQLLREGNDLIMSMLVVLLAIWAASSHWLARPHVFSFLIMLLWNDALRRFEREERVGRLAVVLGVLTVLWVNLHGAFLAGFILLGTYWCGAALDFYRSRDVAARGQCTRRLGSLTLVAAWCGLLSLLNPNGYQLHVHNVEFLRSQFLTNWLAEYASMNFQSSGSHGFLAWLALVFFVLVLCRPRLSASAGLVLISWGHFALYAGRNVPLFAILMAPIITPALSVALPHRLRGISSRMRQRSEAGGGWPTVVVVAIAAILFGSRPIELPAKDWPIGAVAYIRQQPAQFTGNMFNQYVWGGYLLQVLPEHKVFVDGRTDFYSEDLIHEFDDTTALSTNWTQALDKYHVTWTLMPTGHRLNQALASLMPTSHRLNPALAPLPTWQRVYADEVATIYRRDE